MTTDPFYVRVPVTGAIQHRHLFGETPYSLILQAADTRKERTGVHAKVTIAIGTQQGKKLGTTVLAEDTFNVGRSEDRIKLSNHALKEPLLASRKVQGTETNPLAGIAELMAPIIQHMMLTFTRGLYEFHIGDDLVKLVSGATERIQAAWLLEPYILRGGGTIAFAPPGAGKSWTGILFAVLIDAGLAWPWPVTQARTLYVNLERSEESFKARLADVNEALGLPRERPLHAINMRGATLSSIEERLKRDIGRFEIELVVIDSLSRAGAGNMNDNEPANKAMDVLNGLGCAWFLLGHTSRDDAGHLFGSQMFDAAADIMVRVTSQRSQIQSTLGGVNSTLGIGLVGTKANDVALPPLTVTRLEFQKDKGLVAIQKAAPGEFLDIENTARGDDPTEALRKYLLGVGAADIATISRELSIPKRKVARALAMRAEFRIVRTTEEKAYYGVTDLRVGSEDPGAQEYTPEDVEQGGFEDMEGLEELEQLA